MGCLPSLMNRSQTIESDSCQQCQKLPLQSMDPASGCLDCCLNQFSTYACIIDPTYWDAPQTIKLEMHASTYQCSNCQTLFSLLMPSFTFCALLLLLLPCLPTLHQGRQSRAHSCSLLLQSPGVYDHSVIINTCTVLLVACCFRIPGISVPSSCLII
jgi:hypothetical protein